MKADWPQIDAAAVSATADLFGGDLFGDELMDMYNSSAVVGGDGAHGGTIDAITADIPTLGMEDHHPNTAASTTTAKPTSVPSNSDAGGIHPGAQVAMEAAALDLDGDGFGAFRPSTSFNDFGTLLIEDPSSTAPEDATSKAAAGAAAAAASALLLSLFRRFVNWFRPTIMKLLPIRFIRQRTPSTLELNSPLDKQHDAPTPSREGQATR
mmetsp:Transcript_1518/g.3241  ORF Transcript_1518/g.3241 Transcript_1518/m.3241 type:complete len:210 (+) Transcript_1518:520-1149(+)